MRPLPASTAALLLPQLLPLHVRLSISMFDCVYLSAFTTARVGQMLSDVAMNSLHK